MNNEANVTNIVGSVCFEILVAQIPNTSIKYFDVALLIPSSLFFSFLLVYCKTTFGSHVSNNSYIITTFYLMLCVASLLKAIRALVAIINHTADFQRYIDKALWLIVRLFLLSTEMSILTFGVAAAKLDSRTGIRRVLIVTSIISLTYTTVQATLEFAVPDSRFNASDYNYNYTLYGHGGALFFLISSVVFFAVYVIVMLLPFSPLSRRFRLPTKRIFYVYCAILSVLYLIESIGSAMFYSRYVSGLCIIDISNILYFVFYDPLVYATFLRSFFKSRRAIMFRYSQNIENIEPYYDDFKHLTNTTNSSIRNETYESNYSINNHEKIDEYANDDEVEFTQTANEFFPDHYVTLENNTNVQNVTQLLKEFNILPEGAQRDISLRPPSSTIGSERSYADEHETGLRSTIVSINEDVDPDRKSSWSLDDFATKDV